MYMLYKCIQIISIQAFLMPTYELGNYQKISWLLCAILFWIIRRQVFILATSQHKTDWISV